jgi:two-component system nitrate/nitrite response regulator NarP
MSTPRYTRPPVDRLTPREREIMELIALGLSDKDISPRLQISPRTVKTHLGNIYEKLEVRNRTAAAIAYVNRERPCATIPP